MTDFSSTEVLVVGSGPNGLAAAIEMAREGWPVTVLEGAETVGGGMRSAQLTLPGFVHDVCSAIHPMAVSSPFFASLPLTGHGLEWIHPPIPLAHPFDDGTAAVLARSLKETGDSLGADAKAWGDLFEPLVRRWELLVPEILAPPVHLPRHPFALGRFGLAALRSAVGLALRRFEQKRAKGLFAGLAAHSFLLLEESPSAAFGLILGAAGHAAGWPFPRGGSQKIADALRTCLEEMSGKIVTGKWVRSLQDVSGAHTVFLDLTPRQLLQVAEERLPAQYRRHLEQYRYGPGVCKVDWALSGPIPWSAPECREAGTLHLGGTLEEIAEAERDVRAGKHAERPFVIFAQQSLFDPSRAPEGAHTGWAYCHVPSGSDRDVSEAIEAQVERFAPGFRKLIVAKKVISASAYERYNPNYIGGDINGGVQDLRQIIARPVRDNPYGVRLPGIYLCSASTPPGGGVHGMCGFHAAQLALKEQYKGL